MKRIEDYIILETLKKSEQSIVLKVKEASSDTKFVIKLIKKDNKELCISYDKSIFHKNIICCYDCDEIVYEKCLYKMFLLEWANAGCFREFLNHNKKVELDIITQIIEGIQHLHTHNIIHGDIKPENILMHKSNEKLIVKISDYNSNLNNSYNFITPEYSPPEVKKHSVKSDIWSIGCLFYEFFL